MKKTIICLICILAGLILVLPATVAEENLYDNQTIQNAKTNATLNETHITAHDAIPDATKTPKVLRLGFERIKPLNNLDVYGSRATYDIEARGHINSSFNVSQRLGNISNITKNTNYKPYFAVNGIQKNQTHLRSAWQSRSKACLQYHRVPGNEDCKRHTLSRPFGEI